MSKIFSNTLLVSDLDGTLVTGGRISPRNLEALNRFVAQGGKLAVATGRSVTFAWRAAGLVDVNMPCILFNGGLIYDYAAKKRVKEILLPRGCGAYVKKIIERFPDTGVLLLHNGGDDIESEVYFAYPENDMVPFYPRNSGISFDKDDNWYKVLFSVDLRRVEEFTEYVNGLGYDNIHFVTTMANLVEMMPLGVSKGAVLMDLAATYGIPKENVVAIGDYFNDLEMIKMAGLGVAVGDAPDEIKEAADLVVGNCIDGALADLVEHLEHRHTHCIKI